MARIHDKAPFSRGTEIPRLSRVFLNHVAPRKYEQTLFQSGMKPRITLASHLSVDV